MLRLVWSVFFLLSSPLWAREKCDELAFPSAFRDGALGSLPVQEAPGIPAAVQLSGVNVPWMETRAVSADDRTPQIHTIGLHPCVAVVYKLEDENGRTQAACIAHIAYNSKNVPPFTNEYNIDKMHRDCLSKMAATGKTGRLKMLVHGEEPPSEEANATEAARNASVIMRELGARSDIRAGAIRTVYNSESRMRALSYDLTNGKVSIHDQNNSMSLLQTVDF
jgi:hypothetical protein